MRRYIYLPLIAIVLLGAGCSSEPVALPSPSIRTTTEQTPWKSETVQLVLARKDKHTDTIWYEYDVRVNGHVQKSIGSSFPLTLSPSHRWVLTLDTRNPNDPASLTFYDVRNDAYAVRLSFANGTHFSNFLWTKDGTAVSFTSVHGNNPPQQHVFTFENGEPRSNGLKDVTS